MTEWAKKALLAYRLGILQGQPLGIDNYLRAGALSQLMNVLQDLQALESAAQTSAAKTLIGAEIARLKAEAQTAVSCLETHINTLGDEAKALWGKVKELL